jgi:hypothetical protein
MRSIYPYDCTNLSKAVASLLSLEPESDFAKSLESKAKMLLHAQVGSPSTTAQVMPLRALQARLPGI